MKKTLGTALVLVVVAGLIFTAGFSIGKTQTRHITVEGVTNLETGKPPAVDFSLFWEAWNAVEDSYVNSDKLDYQKMVYGAIAGMIKGLGDPYSVFFDPEESKKFMEDVSGFFEGVGMEIGIRDSSLRVIAPLEGTPAARAGIRSGDRILLIGETSTEDMTVEKAVSLIRGPKGSEVTLTLMREGWDKPKEFVIKRAVIEVPSLKWEMKEGIIAYLKIHQFSAKAGRDFARISSEMVEKNAKKIVLDLRGNPGGYLEVSQDIAGWFLERGKTVVIEDFGKGRQQVYQAKGNALFASTPIVVLIDEGSASASEILAGALRDNRGIVLVGKTSFGKGSVQELQSFGDKSSLKITVAHWLTPNGTLIAEKGLTPDVEVERTEEDFEKERDPQLDTALEIIKEL